MTKVELLTAIMHYKVGGITDQQMFDAVDAYTEAINGAKPRVSGSETFTRLDMERSHIAGWNNIDFEDWFQEHYR